MKRRLYVPLAVLLVLLSSNLVFSAWNTDPRTNTPVSLATRDQRTPQSASDGAGGSIITWIDNRNGNGATADIFAQRLDALGNALWTSDGSPVTTAPTNQLSPQIIADGSSGAIIAWQDLRNSATAVDIYAMRMDSSGNPLWTTNGVPVSTASTNQENPQLVSDDSNGAIIVWQDLRNTATATDIYAMRMDSSGNPLWTTDGVSVSVATGDQENPQIASDGSGGAIVAWEDQRNGADTDIFAQRLDPSGNALWTIDGVAVSTANSRQTDPHIISDGLGGAIIVWKDRRSGTSDDIFAQRLDSSGNALWRPNGESITSSFETQENPQIIADGSGGAIIAWQDSRNGTNDIFAQRVLANGLIPWTSDGVPVSIPSKNQTNPLLASDGSGGAIFTWIDWRNLITASDIYAQRLDSSGNRVWTTNGVPISIPDGFQFAPTIVSDGSGGAIIAWEDSRNGDFDLFAQKVNQDGLLGEVKHLIVPWYNDSGVNSSFITVFNPSPQTVTVTVTYKSSKGQDATPSSNLYTIAPASSKAGRPFQVSGTGEGTEAGPPKSMPNARSTAPFGSAKFTALMPFGHSLLGDNLRMGSISTLGDFSGIAPGFSR